MLIGYARVSTDGPDQTTDLQRDALIEAAGDINWQFNLPENTDGYLSLKTPGTGLFAA